jgi:hypothetical protein
MTKLQKIILVLIVLIIVSLGGAGYFFYKYQQAQKEIQAKSDPQKFVAEETKRLVAEISKFIDLPQGEEPTVATVTDIEKLKDEPFFDRAKNGDKVLIYTNAKKAILYDPSLKKIINVAPVNIGTPSAVQNSSPNPQQAAKIVLRNGTDTIGLANKLETDVKNSLPNSQILAKENAAKKDYQETIVVVLNDKFSADGEKLAKDLGVAVGSLPESESNPQEGDILVIFGKDKI